MSGGQEVHGNVEGSGFIQGINVSGGNFTIQQNTHFGPREPPPNPLSAIIPFSRDRRFVPRGDIIERVHQLCSKPAGRAALVGFGGFGKSQLAIEFAHQLRAQTKARGDPWWVLWVHAGTKERVEEAFNEIAITMKIPGQDKPGVDIMQLVYRTLSDETKGRWCMIVDSADDVDIFFDTKASSSKSRSLHRYLPQSNNGSILITTRSRDLAARLTGVQQAIIFVSEMSQGEAIQLLESKAGLTESHTESDAAKKLVKALDHIPLAISQAGSYIQHRGPMSVATYLQRFLKSDDERYRLLLHDADDLRRDDSASKSVLKAWQISFDEIQSRRQSAADLLLLMSFFDCQEIPVMALCPEVRSQSQQRGEIEHQSISEETLDGGFEDDVFVLQQFCFIMVNREQGTFGMHSLVQLLSRRWLKRCGDMPRFASLYVDRMFTAFPEADFENWEIYRVLFPHVEAAIDLEVTDKASQTKWAEVLYRSGRYAYDRGAFFKAEQMVEKARLIYETVCGTENDDTLKCIQEAGQITITKRDFKKAEQLYRQVLDTRRAVLGHDDPRTLGSMELLGDALQRQGRWDEAQELLEHAVERRKEIHGVAHLNTLQAMQDLAQVFVGQGRWQDAEELQTQVLSARQKRLGDEHPGTLAAMHSLAWTLQRQGRLPEAEELSTRVLEMHRRLLGEEHANTMACMSNLAILYNEQGRWEDSKSLNVHVMEIRKRTRGTDHPDTLDSMSRLAITLAHQERLDEAEELEVQVLKARKKVLGLDHPNTLISMHNLAITLVHQGRLSDATSLMQECVSLCRKKLGPDHPQTRNAMKTLNRWLGEARAEHEPEPGQ